MFSPSWDARFRAVHTLQGLRGRHLPGSFRYEEIEHAIDLALNESRTANEFLVRNVLRDAERIRYRAAASHPIVSLLSGENPDQSSLDPADRFEQLVDQEDPESLATLLQEVVLALQALPGNQEVIRRVFDGIVSGETSSEIANATEYSVSYISKTRMLLLAKLQQHFACVGAA